MIDQLGFEQFTFKKLARAIGSTEASVYRYFDNKHRLLTYLIAWYWKWMEYQINYRTRQTYFPLTSDFGMRSAPCANPPRKTPTLRTSTRLPYNGLSWQNLIKRTSPST